MAKKYLKYNNKLVSLNGRLVLMDDPLLKIPEEKTVIPTTTQQIITPTDDDHELSKVTINAIETEEKTATANGEVTPSDGKFLSKVTVNVQNSEAVPTQEKTANPTTSQQEILPDDGYNLSKVTINAVTYNIDSNIQAENIKSGVTILGLTGTLQSAEMLIQNSINTSAEWSNFVGTWESIATNGTGLIINIGETVGDVTVTHTSAGEYTVSNISLTNGILNMTISQGEFLQINSSYGISSINDKFMFQTNDDETEKSIMPYIKKEISITYDETTKTLTINNGGE